MKQRIVVWLEKACDYLDAAPAFYKDPEQEASSNLAIHYCPLGDVWGHPLARWSVSLDQRWDTGVWQVKEAA